jgi:sugar phosphate isomerase/epimerase
MKLGFSPATAFILDLDEAFRLADEIALDFVELGFDLREIASHLQAVKRVRELSRATGVGTTVHLSYIDLNLASLVPAARATSVARSQRGLDYAAEIGASCAVLHSGRHYYRHPLADEIAQSAVHASLNELANPAVPVALENLALEANDLVREPEALQALTERAGFGNCLDFGHASVESRQPWRPEERRGEDLIERYIETLGKSIIHLHLHNNDGAADRHWPTTRGSIDYRRYAPFLRDFGGTACLEILGGAAEVRESARHLREVLTELETT